MNVELKKNNVLNPLVSGESVRNHKIGSVMDIYRFNSLVKLLRVTGYVKRFIEQLKRLVKKKDLIKDELETSNILEAEEEWLKHEQF